MRNHFHLVSSAAVMLSLLTFSLTQAAPPAGYSLLYSDEFDGITSLSQTKFGFGFGWGPTSGAFGEKTAQDQLEFKDNCLIIRADNSNGFTSAAINTKGRMVQKYGYWEVRARVDKHVSGVLPAFWQKQVNENWPPELDIYEFFGTNGKQAMTVHYQGGNSGSQKDIGSAAEFHVYGLEYTKDYIRWITDGTVAREITPSSHGTFFGQWDDDNIYTMINIHMTNNYDWLGTVNTSQLPVRMYVDYFRMYTKGAVAASGQLTVARMQPAASAPRLTVFGDLPQGIAGSFFDPTGRALQGQHRIVPISIHR